MKFEPCRLHFSQNTCSRRFRCGKTLLHTLQQLRDLEISHFDEAFYLDVVDLNGTYFSLNNRRKVIFCELISRGSPGSLRHLLLIRLKTILQVMVPEATGQNSPQHAYVGARALGRRNEPPRLDTFYYPKRRIGHPCLAWSLVS